MNFFALILALFGLTTTSVSTVEYVDLGDIVDTKKIAQCLADKEVVMYGAYWCPHCVKQKQAFGDDFQYVKYQECDDRGQNGDSQKCLAAEIQNYPTWKIPGKADLIGFQNISDLAEYTQCENFYEF